MPRPESLDHFLASLDVHRGPSKQRLDPIKWRVVPHSLDTSSGRPVITAIGKKDKSTTVRSIKLYVPPEVAKPPDALGIHIKDADLDTLHQAVSSRKFIQMYISDVGHTESLLTRHQEIILGLMVQLGLPYAQAAQNLLVQANTRLIFGITEKYKGVSLLENDLVQEGNLGLITAASKYNPLRGTRFVTVAVWWIRQSIGRSISNKDSQIRIPVNRRQKIQRLIELVASHLELTGDQPSVKELADNMDTTIPKVVRLQEDAQKRLPSSLETSKDDGFNRPKIEHIPDLNPSPEAAFEENENTRNQQGLVRHAIDHIKDPYSRKIVSLKFGFTGGKSHTFKELGEMFRMSHGWAQNKFHQGIEEMLQEFGLDLLLCYLEYPTSS